jgi:hypothetical protein
VDWLLGVVLEVSAEHTADGFNPFESPTSTIAVSIPFPSMSSPPADGPDALKQFKSMTHLGERLNSTPVSGRTLPGH